MSCHVVSCHVFSLGNAMSKIVMDFAAAEGNTCVLVSAQVNLHKSSNYKIIIEYDNLISNSM